ncbi:MAG: mannose-1-phosphate guanylyltransferase [Muribaculaceae bacterium]|nr:mannose-1-phosphate guanylyltransferase [Muribaculaceae bacterium]MBQ3960787.1 mannose-1-phosphate guanylyltransferase [Muribaculaceae bacterium]MBQ5467028.1 mannose-1-phosphate guanylyltransferase [Muribaculaceae bacterium]
MNNRYCVIMCGGVGSRFWPYSRSSKPKQFIDFLGTGKSLLQLTVERLKGIVPVENIIMLTNEQYAGLIEEQLPEIGKNQILLEPARRNTAPCNAWAAYHIKAMNPDAVIMVAPSDHLILNTEAFRASVLRAYEFVESRDALLTFGVKPNRPETGYGYIQLGDQIDAHFSRVKTFTEKPDLNLAKVFLQSGEFYWNSGMFFWHVDSILRAVRELVPDMAARFEAGQAVFGTPAEQDFINGMYASCANVSIDYAIMEKAINVCVERVDFGWTDLGTWGALYDVSDKNEDGNVTQNCQAMLFNSRDNVIALKGDKLIVASGLNNYIIADADDVLLIVPKDEEQKIRQYVNEVKLKYGDKFL